MANLGRYHEANKKEISVSTFCDDCDKGKSMGCNPEKCLKEADLYQRYFKVVRK